MTSDDLSRDLGRLCATWRELGMPQELADEYRRHIEASGDDIDAWLDVTSALRRGRRYHEGERAYEVMARRHAESKYVWNSWGVLRRDACRFDGAIECFERALALAPGDLRAIEGRAEANLLAGRFGPAAAGFEEVVARGHRHPVTLRNLGISLMRLERLDEALEAFGHAVRAAPDDTATLFDQAALLQTMGRRDEAIATLRRLSALDPEDRDVRDLLATLESEPPAAIPVKGPGERERQHVVRRRDFGDMERLRGILNGALAEGQPPPPKPPKLFVSYRWGQEADDAWVANLVRDLELRGYDVVFDEQVQQGRSEPLPVPELVGLVVTCTHFVPILTERYRRRVELAPQAAIPIEDGWVFDEYQAALELGRVGRVVLQGIWRSGPAIPAPFTKESACDFRDDRAYAQCLDEHFPVRMATVIGIRADGTVRAIGPIPRTEVQRIGRELESSEAFVQFLIRHE